MGSVEGFAKGQQPMLDRVKWNIELHNAKCAWIASRVPLWRRLLALLPNPKQYSHDWQSSYKRDKEWEAWVNEQLAEAGGFEPPDPSSHAS